LPNVGPYIYTTLAFLALLGAPYIYDISSLRVNRLPSSAELILRYCLHNNQHFKLHSLSTLLTIYPLLNAIVARPESAFWS